MDNNPYTTIDQDGWIYSHVNGDTIGDHVANIHDGDVRNLHGDRTRG